MFNITMSKSSILGAGHGSSTGKNANTNLVQVGDKLQGLPSTIGRHTFGGRSHGTRRHYIFDICRPLSSTNAQGIDYATCGTPLISPGTVDFSSSAGRYRSTTSYTNIKSISANVDLSRLKSLSDVNAAFYMIQQASPSSPYCDSGGNGNCGEIDFLETNGLGIIQSTIHFPEGNGAGNSQTYEYTWTGASTNQNFTTPTSFNVGEHDASSIDFTKPVPIQIDFQIDNGNYTGMTILLGQIQIFSSTGASNSIWSTITDSMSKGWVIVCSYWQGFSPKPTGWYTDNVGWSNLCPATGPIFSDIQVIT